MVPAAGNVSLPLKVVSVLLALNPSDGARHGRLLMHCVTTLQLPALSLMSGNIWGVGLGLEAQGLGWC